jgi:hypothetical protein
METEITVETEGIVMGNTPMTRTLQEINLEDELFSRTTQIAIVVLSQLAVLFFRWNTFNPPSVGWFEVLAKQISTPKPYNRYEIKFPPLGILIEGKLPLFLADVFGANVYMAERYWHVVAWILFSVSVYLLSTTYCGFKYSLVPVSLGLTIYQLQPYKIIAGYLELAVTMWALGTYLMIISSRREPNALSRRLFITGSMVLYSSWLVKQSFLFSIFCSLLAVLILRDGYFWQRLKLISGSLIVFLLVVTLWAAKVGGSAGFWYTMFDGSSKGMTLEQIPIRIIQWGILLPMTNYTAISLLLVSCIILGVHARENSTDAQDSDPHLAIVLRIVYTVLLGFFFVSLFSMVQFKYVAPVLVLATGLVLKNMMFKVFRLIPSIHTTDKLQTQNSRSHYMLLVVAFWITSYALYLHSDWSLGLSPAGSFVINIMTNASVFFIVFCLFEYSGLLSSHFNFRNSRRFLSSKMIFDKQFPLISTILVCVAIPVMNSLSGGTTFESWMFAFILMATFFVYTGTKLFSRFNHEVLLVLAVLLIIPSGFSVPYSWWGLDASPISLDSANSDPIVSGLKINDADAVLFQELDKVIIDESNIVLAAGRKPRVFMGPQIVGLQLRYEIDSLETTCAIVWFDVCSAESASKTFEEIKTGKPDLIVWLVEPNSVFLGHEEAFGNGEQSEVRKFQSWLLRDSCKVGYESIVVGSSPWYHDNMHFVVFVNRGLAPQCK